MTHPTTPQGTPTIGARSRRRLGTAVLMAAVLAAVLAAPASPADAASNTARAVAVCERLERLVDDLFGRVLGALRPERLGQKPDPEPTAAPSSDDLVEDDPPALRPERLGGRPH